MADAPRDVVVGIDIGTTSAKAVAFDASGEPRATGRAGYPLHEPLPGRAEQDAAQVVDAAFRATVAAVKIARAEGHRIAGLSLSGAMHGLVGVDDALVPVTPLLTWADRRAAPEAARLRATPEARGLHRRTGTPIHPMSALLKLRWLADHEPAVAAKARHWTTPKDLLLARLSGRLVSDHGLASGSGMFDLVAERWDPEALAYAGVDPRRLPPLVPTTETLALAPDAARVLGLPAGTPVVAGGADGPLANLGVGVVRPGAVACSIGTSGALRAASATPQVDDHGRTFCYVLAPGAWVVGGAVNNGGVVVDWCGDTLAPDVRDRAERDGRPAAEALLDLAGQAPAGSDGVLFLPQLLGERAPRWAGAPQGAFVGLRLDHGREHLLRAAVEGVCLQLAVVLRSIASADLAVDEIRATGGFARSPLWRRILAAAFGRSVGFPQSPEGSALGAALLGMTALGILPSLEAAAAVVAVELEERPEAEEIAVYREALVAYRAAFDALAGPDDARG